MRRDYFYIVIAIFMVIVVAVFITLSILGQQKRDYAVRELQSKVAEITDSQFKKNAISNYKKRASIAAKGKDKQEIEEKSEDIAAHEKLAEKMKMLKEGVEWEQFMESLLRIEKGEDTEEDIRQVTVFLDENQDIINDLRRIAGTNSWFSDELGILDIQYVRLLAVKMALSARKGDYETLFLDFRAAEAIAATWRKQYDLSSWSVCKSMYFYLYRCIEKNVVIQELSPDQIKELITFADEAADRERIADILLVESEDIMDIYDAYRSIDTATNPFLVFYATIGRPFLDMDEGYYADTMNQAYITLHRPYNEAKPILEDLQKIEFSELSIFLHPFSFIFVPAFTRYAQQQAFHEAQMGLMQVGLAVEQYYMQHDEYPQTLDAIAPDLGGELPLDPYTGQNFVYESGNTDFTLYSALGSMVSAEEYKYPCTDNSGNIVWRYRKE